MSRQPLIDELFQEPYRFDFFQAVRILNRFADEGSDSTEADRTEELTIPALEEVDDPEDRDSRFRPVSQHAVGEDLSPEHECVRFRTVASLSFPAGEIVALQKKAATTSDAPKFPPEMTVAFLGLTGPHGVLPRHYTAQLIERIRAKDYALRDFLDLFHHRLVSLFYRAWEKYRFPFAYERKIREGAGDRDDLFTSCLFALIGLGTKNLRGRLQFDDEAFLYYGGFFAHAPRNAVSLEAMLSDYFEMRVGVISFQGQWLYLDRSDQTSFPQPRCPDGLHCCLGSDVIIGERVWDIEGKFRVRLGPLGYADFRRFMPNGSTLLPLCQMVRSYCGVSFDFDVQPVLRASEVPWCRLGGVGSVPSQLGWNTWIRSRNSTNDAYDAVFAGRDW